MRSLAVILSFLVAMFAAPALAGEEIAYGPAPAWVTRVPIPEPGKDPGGAFHILLMDQQVRHFEDREEIFTEYAIKVLNAQGLDQLGTISAEWDPQTQSLSVHSAEIVRDGKDIDLLASGERFSILRREERLAQSMLDGRLTAIKGVEGLRVGDVVHVATSLTYRDALRATHPEGWTTLGQGLVGRVRYRALWPKSREVRWKTTEGFGDVVRTETGDTVEIQMDRTNVSAPRAPDNAPARFNLLAELELTSFPDWEAVSRAVAPLYESASTLPAGSPLKAEAAKIRATHATPEARALAALQLVEREVRYLALLMGEGGYTPAHADLTWERRYGDCKGKTALLLALLKELDIEAEAAVVHSTQGDAIPARLPRLGAFDHVIVRAVIADKVYWLDGTRSGDRDLADLTGSSLRWALPVRTGGAGLEAMALPAPARPMMEALIELDSTAGFDKPAHGKMTFILRGELGQFSEQMFASAPRAEIERYVKESWAEDLEWIKVDKFDYGWNDEVGGLQFVLEGPGSFEWGTWQGRRFLQLPSSFKYGFEARPAGPGDDAPFALPHPMYTREFARVRLPRDERFTVQGEDVQLAAGGFSLKRTARLENGELVVEMITRTEAPEVSVREAKAAVGTFDRMASARDVMVLSVGRSASARRALERETQLNASFERARNLLRAGRRQDALVAVDELLALDAKNRVGLEMRAGLYLALDKPDLALKDARALQRLPVVSPAAPRLEIQALAAVKDFRQLLSRSDRLVKANPKDPYGLLWRGVAEAGLGRPDAMLASLESAYALAGPKDAEFPLEQLGKVWLTLPQDRKDAFDAVLVARPASPSARVLRGFFQATKDPRLAVPQFDQALTLEPDFTQARRLRVNSHLRLQQHDKAIADLDHLIDQGERRLVGNRGMVHLELKNTDLALRDLDEAISSSPNDAALLNNRCWIRAVADVDAEKALQDCNESLRLSPDYKPAFDSRGLVYLRLDRAPEALADYDSALAGRDTASSLYGRGLAKKKLGDKDGADADFAKAIKLEAGIARTYEGYGLSP